MDACDKRAKCKKNTFPLYKFNNNENSLNLLDYKNKDKKAIKSFEYKFICDFPTTVVK